MLPGNLSTGIGPMRALNTKSGRGPAHQKRLKLQEWFQCQLQESPALTTLLQWGKHATQVLFFWWTIDHIGWSWMLAPQHYNFNHLKPEGQQLKLHLTPTWPNPPRSLQLTCVEVRCFHRLGLVPLRSCWRSHLRSWQQKKTMGFRPVEGDVDGVSSGKNPGPLLVPGSLDDQSVKKFCWLKEQLFQICLTFL